MVRRIHLQCIGLALLAMCAACSDDDTTPAGAGGGDGGPDASTGTGGAEASSGTGGTDASAEAGTEAGRDGAIEGGDAADGDAQAWDAGDASTAIARGDYLVNHLLACPDCHTPRTAAGPDMTKFLAGNAHFAMAPLGADGGLVPIGSKNLTPDPATGLGNWTDAQIKHAFLDGMDDQGKPLISIMPYYVFHNMSASDADAIVAYLRSIPAVSNVIPEHPDLPAPAQIIDVTSIPKTTLAAADPNYASAVRGRYLAAETGACIECHTKHTTGTSGPPLTTTGYFAGGEAFSRDQFGLPPTLPPTITSANLTPDPTTGLHNFTAADVVKVLHQGVAPDGLAICPPMPVGPLGAYGGITDQDALDIANYILTLPPIQNDTGTLCDFRAATGDGGGPSEGGAPDAADAKTSSDASDAMRSSDASDGGEAGD